MHTWNHYTREGLPSKPGSNYVYRKRFKLFMSKYSHSKALLDKGPWEQVDSCITTFHGLQHNMRYLDFVEGLVGASAPSCRSLLKAHRTRHIAEDQAASLPAVEHVPSACLSISFNRPFIMVAAGRCSSRWSCSGATADAVAAGMSSKAAAASPAHRAPDQTVQAKYVCS